MPESISRRQLLGRAASVAATLVVSQSVAACSDGTDPDDGGTVDGCVLTAALTEGLYFVDERLTRSDIRSDPTSGEVSQGVPLDLTCNVSRVAGGQCTPLTGAYLDVWHCDAAGVYSDVQGAGATRSSCAATRSPTRPASPTSRPSIPGGTRGARCTCTSSCG